MGYILVLPIFDVYCVVPLANLFLKHLIHSHSTHHNQDMTTAYEEQTKIMYVPVHFVHQYTVQIEMGKLKGVFVQTALNNFKTFILGFIVFCLNQENNINKACDNDVYTP